jgi:Rrf2 family protein
MIFSQTSEYALRVVVHLASLKGAAATIPQIAEATRAPAGYLAKVIKSLSRANVLISQRGKHGGSVLARSADTITVLEVIAAVDPIQRIKTCPLNIASHGTNLCSLHRRMDQSIALVQDALDRSTIAEMVQQSGGSSPLLDKEAPPKTLKITVKP